MKQYLSNGIECEVKYYCQTREAPCRACGQCLCVKSNAVRFNQEVKNYTADFQKDWDKRIEEVMSEENITRQQAVEELLKIENEL